MSGHSRKDHLGTIRSALTTAAKSFGYLVRNIACAHTPRAARPAAQTKSADIAVHEARAGTDYTEMVDTFMADWPEISAETQQYYGPQSPELVAYFILVQSGMIMPPFNAKDLAAHPSMAAAYDWLPPTTPPRIGDIAVYGPGPRTSNYGTCGVVVEVTGSGMYPRIYTQGFLPPSVMTLGRTSLLGYWRHHG